MTSGASVPEELVEGVLATAREIAGKSPLAAAARAGADVAFLGAVGEDSDVVGEGSDVVGEGRGAVLGDTQTGFPRSS